MRETRYKNHLGDTCPATKITLVTRDKNQETVIPHVSTSTLMFYSTSSIVALRLLLRYLIFKNLLWSIVCRHNKHVSRQIYRVFVKYKYERTKELLRIGVTQITWSHRRLADQDLSQRFAPN